MEPIDTPPGGRKTIAIYVTPNTVILIAGLLLLVITLLLILFFPPDNSDGVATTATTTAQSSTRTAISLRLTTTPASDIPSAMTPAPTPSGNPPGGYPPPTELADETNPLTATPFMLPTFDPIRPTTAPGQPPSTPDFGGQATSYPPPDLITPTPTDDPFAEEPPTQPPQPTIAPTTPELPPPTARPTVRPRPTSQPAGGSDATPRPIKLPTPQPTSVPVDVLTGANRWTVAQSPILIKRDQHLVAGASLIIEPGVEVRLAPGVSFFVDGTMYVLGSPERPVRLIGSERMRWEGIFGRPGSNIAMEHTEIRGGGAGGTVLLSEEGNLVLRHVGIRDNGGHVQVNSSRLEVRDSEIAGNDMPYGAALEANYEGGGIVTFVNNRIGGNRMASGAAPVQINNLSPFEAVVLDIQRNLLIGQDGPDLVLSTNGPLQGALTCNTLINGTNGLSVRTETLQVPGFSLTVRDNAIEDHTPPIIPVYLEYGIGRGATSEVALDMRYNWWENPLGPYEPDRYADGRGEAVGDNIEFIPWLTERPACAPRP